MTLRELVNSVAADISPARFKDTEIINDIRPSLLPCRDHVTLRLLLGVLMKDAYKNTRSRFIRISARKFHNLKVIYIRHSDLRAKSGIEADISLAHSLVQKLGGCIYITENKTNGTTIAFTFVVEQFLHFVPSDLRTSIVPTHLPGNFSKTEV